MLRRLGIRGKVLAALGVPVLVLVLLAGLVSWQSVQQTRAAQSVTALLDVFDDSRAVVTALQAERRVAVPFASGSAAADLPAQLDGVRAATTTAVTTLEDGLAGTDLTTLDPAVAAAADDLLATLGGLAEVRALVDTRTAAVGDVLAGFAPLTDATAAFPGVVADALDDRGLAAVLSASADVTALVESYSEEQVLGVATLDAPRTTTSLLQLAALFPATQASSNQATAAVEQLDRGLAVPPLGASDNGVTSYATYRAMVATGDPAATAAFSSADWAAAADAEIAALAPVEADRQGVAVADAALAAQTALRTTLITLGLALAAVILSVVTALVVARQIVRPLRRLTDAVGAVRAELPQLVEQVAVPGQGPDLALVQIPVTSNDEIGRLAAAFNDVNATTIQVAQEQAALRGSIAEMFVNVARRDQVLLNRQLTFIDSLERSEEDPNVLADLFRLDHLATRMRRNAESLLVLAGIDTGRRLRDTLPLSDVVRTASSEIEHYERVLLDLPVDPMMLGHTALPAAHLLAELLENATMFSEPGSPVHVSTGIDETHVLVTVLDQGLGMTAEEIEQA
ncbi:MAG TPA: nitrate- and nitrite sensing domain-containing protein, partial [Actinotalea sp.]|nr:nitrate- and nitrite sensing domain-containing protein [Actinotalea sp.]